MPGGVPERESRTPADRWCGKYACTRPQSVFLSQAFLPGSCQRKRPAHFRQCSCQWPQSAVHDCGLITSRKEGKYIYYSLTTPELNHLLEVIDATVESMHWSPTEDIHCDTYIK